MIQRTNSTLCLLLLCCAPPASRTDGFEPFEQTGEAAKLLLESPPATHSLDSASPQQDGENLPEEPVRQTSAPQVDAAEKKPDKEPDDDSPKNLKERWENLGLLYDNDEHPYLQELWFLGRYHGQMYEADGNLGKNDHWENRRFRIGSQARMFDKLTLHAQMVSGFDLEPFYNGFTELWSQWAFDEMFLFTIGQQKHRFTHDRNLSSRYLNTLERSMLLNMFAADYTPAVTVAGRSDEFSYYTGIFSNATGPDVFEAMTDFNSGYSLLAAATWNVEESLDFDEATIYSSWLYSDFNANATNLNRFKDGFSTALILTEGPYSLVSEALLGTRSANGDAIGINIQPGYFFTEKLQLATRYQLAFSDEDDGLLAQRRYERTVGLTTGDVYQAGYVGFNYYIAGHRMKLMQGIEYADMSGDDAWTVSLAFRCFWGPHSNGPFPSNKLLKP